MDNLLLAVEELAVLQGRSADALVSDGATGDSGETNDGN